MPHHPLLDNDDSSVLANVRCRGHSSSKHKSHLEHAQARGDSPLIRLRLVDPGKDQTALNSMTWQSILRDKLRPSLELTNGQTIATKGL